ncbi:cystathionine beta-lyase [Tremella mesenterica]|uniref:Cystathionine beta-lyase n=1 Tax=Tremella mesenterica TaxID=5217 RepID=A0A4Q1BML7_TREME|nr:cystathionine beta-lyase [Tremella mesenterica]
MPFAVRYPPSPSETSLATSIFETTPAKSVSEEEAHLARSAKWQFSTLCASVDNKDQYGSSAVPIYQTATFKGMDGPYDYTRSGNPTRGALEAHLAKLYGAHACYALSTGMTCLDVILRLVKPGETVLAGDDLYGGTNRLLTYIGTHGGVDVRHVDTTRLDELEPHLGPGNKSMVLLESPTNPLLKIADIPTICAAVKAAAPSALIVVDNTMMSPYLQRPLNLGADIVYDSGTKYLSGHHDLMAGIIAVGEPEVAKSIAFLINAVGCGLAPFDCFLLLRGIKTMSVRMDRQIATAELVALYLHELGFLVHYPGLKSHPKRDIHYKQATGAGAVLSFTTGDKSLSEKVVGSARLWGISVSFGAVNSLISMPCLMSHASISAAVRAERGLPEDLIRLCVGIEDPRDLIDDLEHSLFAGGAIVPDLSHPTLSHPRMANLYELGREHREHWVIERARAYKRSLPENAIQKLVDGVKRGLGFSSIPRKQLANEITVSAPGKVILFGEHAVVHGVTAIASSVDLRCYAVLTPRSDHKIALEASDSSIELEWDISALPWNLLPLGGDRGKREADKELDSALLHSIEALVEDSNVNKTGKGASVTLLYTYMLMAGNDVNAPGVTLTVSSTLPIGAGLGSSAAYSTCVSTSLLLAHSYIDPPKNGFDPATRDVVDSWAFLCEKILHGNPSGIDNAVSVRGGAVAFTRAMGGRAGGLEGLHGFSSIRLLLTNTLVPRDTKSLVARVSAKRLAEPEVVDPILKSIQTISDEAKTLLSGTSDVGRQALVLRLETLIRQNQVYLTQLGVSHPSLEMIVAATTGEPFNLATKLTGAGGGGCALTLIPDGFSETSLQALMEDLTNLGFQPHLTALGGSGVGFLLSPTSDERIESDTGEGMTIPKRSGLRDAGSDGLANWAESLGTWVY